MAGAWVYVGGHNNARDVLAGFSVIADGAVTEVADNGSAPRFSIVIPAFNEHQLLPRCLESLADQDSDARVEIIVVDNASTDGTAEIAEAHGAKVVLEPRRGVCAARQRGTEEAQGEIVISTDADTTFAPDWLTKIDESFAADERVVAVAGSVCYVDAPGWASCYTKLLFGVSGLVARLRGRPLYVSACNLAFKRSAWVGYNTRLTQGGDEFDQLRRLKHKGRVVLDQTNPTFTSSRRLQKGLLYNLFVSLLTYYVLDYLIARVIRRSLFGSSPAIRTVNNTNRQARIAYQVVAVSAVALVLFTPLKFTLVEGAVHLPRAVWHEIDPT